MFVMTHIYIVNYNESLLEFAALLKLYRGRADQKIRGELTFHKSSKMQQNKVIRVCYMYEHIQHVLH